MSRPDEGLIHQWLDGECTPEESARLERLVATDAEWAAAVAEARGLIAASSRIVGALDAVPRAMPTGSVAARTRTRGRPLPAWVGLAAGLVLVAGTAYVLREESAAPFGTVTPPRAQQESFDAARGEPAPTIGPVESPPPAAPVPPATASAPAPSPPLGTTDALVAEKRHAATAEAAADARRAEEWAAEQERAMVAERRRVMRAADAPRGAVARSAEPMAASSGTTLPRLDGCWRVSAPPELVGVLEAPVIVRAAGDTLVLLTSRGDITVTRTGDTLRGGLEATLQACGAPAVTPRPETP